MTITIETAPVDEHGRLVHADDAIAQTCLAVMRLESALALRGLPASAITAVRLLTADPAAGDLVEVVVEELEKLAATASVDVVAASHLTQSGMIVRLQADVLSTTNPNHPLKGANMRSIATDITALRQLGSILVPGEAGYAEACQAWNLAVRQHPAAVAVPESIDEVKRVVQTAATLGLRIAPQSTGHAASTLDDVDFDNVVLLRMHQLTGVTIDPVSRTARVLGGTLWRDVVAAAAPHGLTALHGSAGDVAVAGYMLGGGLSFYAREYGLTTSTVRAIEVITASGNLVRATATRHPDLFWALRGGGGNFGVVVAIELELIPISDIVAGMLLWDLERAPEVLHTWAEWTATVPETVTTNIRMMRFPPLPELPPFLSGRSIVVIDGALHEDDERAAELLSPLRRLSPELDTFARIPAQGLLEVHMDPPAPTPSVSDHSMLSTLPEEAIATLLKVAGPGVDTPLMFAELRHLGGAVARPHDAALSHLSGHYALFALCVAPTPELFELGGTVTASVVDALRPWSNGGSYSNFTDRPSDASNMFSAPDWQRLIQVRDLYDPRRTWIASHAVGGR